MKPSRSFQRTINQCLQILCAALLFFQSNTQAQTPVAEYNPKFDTIAHKWLRVESEINSITPNMYTLLDEIIEEASTKIRATHKEAKIVSATPDDARLIDDVLVAHNFVYPGTGLQARLSDTLGGVNVSQKELDAIKLQPHNARRLSHIQDHDREPFHLADCDNASLIFLAVFENLNLDCSMIEIPGHVFIRCYENGKPSFNFETMDGTILSDSYYKQIANLPEESVQNGVYLSRLSTENVLGIAHFVLAEYFGSKLEYARAISEYEISGRMHGRSSAVWNDLAWLYATARDAKFRDAQKAVEYASRALSIFKDGHSLDTIACAYAESGDFDKAQRFEKEACSISRNPDFVKNILAYRDHKTWLQVHQPAYSD